MKFIVTMMVMITSISAALAANKVVYGRDDRSLIEYTSIKNERLAKSTVAMIPVSDFKNARMTGGNKHIAIKTKTLRDRYTSSKAEFCPNVKFGNLPALSKCTGFLITKNHIVTAGHCVKSANDCVNNKWVFDYKASNYDKRTKEVLLKQENIYSCRKVVKQVFNHRTKNDYAIVELDRPVEGRRPLKIRHNGKIASRTPLMVIGHPSGLPAIATLNGVIRNNRNNIFFNAVMDTFSGNSGSAVFNARTGIVEGILVRGEKDYVIDEKLKCIRPKVCSAGECRGEDVTRIKFVSDFMGKHLLP